MTKLLSLSLLSGILLMLAFPAAGIGALAWGALIPFLWALRHSKDRGEALLCAIVTASVFYGISLIWLCHVSTIGWVIVVAIQVFFFCVFTLLAFWERRLQREFLRPFWTAACWMAVEFIRSEIPAAGFGWNLMAYTQSDHPVILQAANTVGAYGLGFLIIWINAVLFQFLFPANTAVVSKKSLAGSDALKELAGRYKAQTPSLILAVLAAVLLFAHGSYHLKQPLTSGETMRVSVVQGNIPQNLKWEFSVKQKITEIYMNLTKLAHFERPELVIWPESAYPGYLNQDQAADEIFGLAAGAQIPMLVGSPHFEDHATIFNSAYYIEGGSRSYERYDKIRLVPFGEYVPLKGLLGWLEPLAYSMGVSDFSAGQAWRVFTLPNQKRFSALICFEDIFPQLARRFVREGADFLTVITNDAWFGRSAAPYQHLQASVFRAVENGVSVIRAANTGVSAFISPKGKVLGRIGEPGRGDIFVTGQKTLSVPVGRYPTLYGRGGFAFVYVSFLLLGILFYYGRKQ